MPGDDVLREMLRELERILDQQLRAVEEQDDRAEQAVTVAIATLGGGLGLASVVAGVVPTDPMFLLLLGVAASVNLGALHHFLRAYLGIPKALQIGPQPAWVRSKARDPAWTMGDHLQSLVENLPDYCHGNADILRQRAAELYRGTKVLLMAIGAYAIATVYILGRGVLW